MRQPLATARYRGFEGRTFSWAKSIRGYRGFRPANDDEFSCRYTARMERFRLRVAGVEDVAGIRELIGASVRGLQAGDYSVAQIEASLATVFTIDSQLIVDGSYFVAL